MDKFTVILKQSLDQLNDYFDATKQSIADDLSESKSYRDESEQHAQNASYPANANLYDDEADFLTNTSDGDFGIYDGAVWKNEAGTAVQKIEFVTTSTDEGGLLIGNTNPVRVATARDNARGSLTVQPTKDHVPGSVEIFPSGTSQRSHFLACNANDPDNMGFVKFEARINGSDNEGLIRAAAKGTGSAPTQFRWENFPDGIIFENTIKNQTSDPHFFRGTSTGSNGEVIISQSLDDEVGVLIKSRSSGNRVDVRRYDDRLTINMSSDDSAPDIDHLIIYNNGNVKCNKQFEAVGNAKFNNRLLAQDTVILSGLPTSDPLNANELWNDGGTLKISSG